MKKIYVATNGCEEGQLKSMNVLRFFKVNGFTVSENLAETDFIVFFACGLTEAKERNSISIIKRMQKQKSHSTKLIVWGCLPKINPQKLKKIYSGPIVGPKDLDFFNTILEKRVISIHDVNANSIISPITAEETISGPAIVNPINGFLWKIKRNVDRFRLPHRKWLFDSASYFIRAAEGCTGNCTYCSEKAAWGKIKSRSIGDITTEFKIGLEKGYKRFFLVAGDLGSYGADLNTNIVELLNEILTTGGDHDYSLIINQINPSDLGKFLPELEMIFASGKIEALGCQVESGSNRILKMMGRHYSAESWRASMLKINKNFPLIRLSTHIMIGFPTETKEDFKETLKLLDLPLFIDWLGFFIFSPRPTVYASRFKGQIPCEIKQLRFNALTRKYLLMYIINILINNCRYVGSKVKKML